MDISNRIRYNVIVESGGLQTPQTVTQLTSDVYLVPSDKSKYKININNTIKFQSNKDMRKI